MEYLKNERVLITGGAGFIGSNIVEYLLTKTSVEFVRVLDNLSTGFYDNIKKFMDYNNFEFMYGDITDLSVCKKACHNITKICHQAALGSVPRSISDPLKSHEVNVNGTLNIFLAAKEMNIKRIVFASSSSVYGSDNSFIKKEDDIGYQLSPYAITKYTNELYGRLFTKLYGMECIGLRYFNVFGPKQNPNGVYAAVIPKFIKLMLKNEPPIINGNGTNSRDFTYVTNVVYANILALTTNNSNAFDQIFNVGTNNPISLNQLVDSINKVLNTNITPIYTEPRLGDILHSNASIDKIKKELGYNVINDFHTGLISVIKYLSEH